MGNPGLNPIIHNRILHEYVSNSSATDADDLTSFVTGTTGEGNGAAGGGSVGVIRTTNITVNAGRKKRIRFHNAIVGSDLIILEIWDGFNWLPIQLAYCFDNGTAKLPIQSPPYISVNRAMGIVLMSVSNTEIDVLFGRQAMTDYIVDIEWSSAGFLTGTQWRVHKISFN